MRFAGKRGDQQDGKGNGLGIGCGAMNTLTNGDVTAVCYGIGNGQGDIAGHITQERECVIQQGKPPRRYIIRRLNARLSALVAGIPRRTRRTRAIRR